MKNEELKKVNQKPKHYSDELILTIRNKVYKIFLPLLTLDD